MPLGARLPRQLGVERFTNDYTQLMIATIAANAKS